MAITFPEYDIVVVMQENKNVSEAFKVIKYVFYLKWCMDKSITFHCITSIMF